jgi:putative membrane protein
MSIRQYRPKRNQRGGVSGKQRLWLSIFLISTIGLQISYPLVKGEALRWVTIATIATAAIFVSIDAFVNFGQRFALTLIPVALAFGFAIEAIGQKTDWPFGKYTYSPSLGFALLDVPLIVPFAWLMMSYPVLLVARKITTHWVFLIGGFGLMGWDLFIDPQMVAAKRWVWEIKGSTIPFESAIPLSNALGWLLSGMALMAILHKVIPVERRKKETRTKHLDVFLIWTFFSSIIGNIFFFHAPGVALIGGLVFGVFLAPFLYRSILGIPEIN